MSSPPFFLRDSRASETQARVKITLREKRRHAVGRDSLPAMSSGYERYINKVIIIIIFTSACVSLALLSLRKNGGLLVV